MLQDPPGSDHHPVEGCCISRTGDAGCQAWEKVGGTGTEKVPWKGAVIVEQSSPIPQFPGEPDLPGAQEPVLRGDISQSGELSSLKEVAGTQMHLPLLPCHAVTARKTSCLASVPVLRNPVLSQPSSTWDLIQARNTILKTYFYTFGFLPGSSFSRANIFLQMAK